MCGIFIARKVSRPLTRNLIETMYEANKDRGGRGVGLSYHYTVPDDPELKDFRYHWGFKGYTFEQVWHNEAKADVKIIMGHTVAPTGVIDPQSRLQCNHVTDGGGDFVIHPLSINSLSFAHNGIIHNPDSLETSHQMYAGLDSSALFSDIYHNYVYNMKYKSELNDYDDPMAKAIASTMGVADGSAGCWLSDSIEHKTYIWRNMSSIWYGLVDGVMMYSSAKMKGLNLVLPEGVVYEVNQAVSPRPVAFFTPKSIY